MNDAESTLEKLQQHEWARSDTIAAEGHCIEQNPVFHLYFHWFLTPQCFWILSQLKLVYHLSFPI